MKEGTRLRHIVGYSDAEPGVTALVEGELSCWELVKSFSLVSTTTLRCAKPIKGCTYHVSLKYAQALVSKLHTLFTFRLPPGTNIFLPTKKEFGVNLAGSLLHWLLHWDSIDPCWVSFPLLNCEVYQLYPESLGDSYVPLVPSDTHNIFYVSYQLIEICLTAVQPLFF